MAQSDSLIWTDRFSLVFGLGVSDAIGPFDRKFSKTPWSLSFNLGFKPNHNSFQFAELRSNYQRLAQFQKIFPVQSPQGGLVEISHSSRSNLLSMGLGYRYEFQQLWFIIPKVGFSFGGCNAYVFSSLRDNFSNELIENYREASDWSYFSMLEIGFNVPVYPGVHFSILGSYFQSGSLDIYLPLQEPLFPTPVNPFDNFELRRTAIDLLALEIGVTLYFDQLN